jgi:A/G-specific adenine glycosylase
MPGSPLHVPVLRWYAANARDLPWRRPGTTPWGVLVSEVMLQQTPAARVAPVYGDWLARWPRPVDLAEVGPDEAIRAWGRLGYPRRALRLHQAAVTIRDRHAGDVPRSYVELLALPGVGAYTAAAVATFGFGARHAVLDTNVRRVLARAVGGQALPGPAMTRTEQQRAAALVPDDPADAAAWAVAVMELGALVCRAQAPACTRCPIQAGCAWFLAGRPAYAGPRRSPQRFAGTDREARGRLLARIRESAVPVPAAALTPLWPDPVQRARALNALITDGLVEPVGGGFGLPR